MADRKQDSRQNPSVARRSERVTNLFLLLASVCSAFTGIMTLGNAKELLAAETDLSPILATLLLPLLVTFNLYFWPVVLYLIGWMAKCQRERAARIWLGLAVLLGFLLIFGGLGVALVSYGAPILGIWDSGMSWVGELATSVYSLHLAGLFLGVFIDYPEARSIRLFPRRGAKATEQHEPR